MTSNVSSPFVRTFFLTPLDNSNEKILKTISEFGSNVEMFSLLSSTEVLKSPHSKVRIKALAKDILFDGAEPRKNGYVVYAAFLKHYEPLKALINRFEGTISRRSYQDAWSLFSFFAREKISFDFDLLKVLECLVTSSRAINALHYIPNLEMTGHWQVCSTGEVLDLSKIFACAYKYNRPLSIEGLSDSSRKIRRDFLNLKLKPEERLWLNAAIKNEESCSLM